LYRCNYDEVIDDDDDDEVIDDDDDDDDDNDTIVSFWVRVMGREVGEGKGIGRLQHSLLCGVNARPGSPY